MRKKMSKSNQTKPPSVFLEAARKLLWHRRILWSGILAVLVVISFLTLARTTEAAKRDLATLPNIVLFLADDAGYSDYHPFGGEANTPTVDAFAAVGMKFSNFHAQTTCSPTRAELVTGVDNHLAGYGTMMGNVTQDLNHPQYRQDGYTGHLNERVVTIATLLQASGYHTYHVGKWHLGLDVEVGGVATFPRGYWPIDKGFEKSYGMLNGGAEHFGVPERNADKSTAFFENDQLIYTGGVPAGYFSAKNHTAKAIEYINAGRASDGGQRKPFFLFYAITLPHEPNQVPDTTMDPVSGISNATLDTWANYYYTTGWDQVRADRLATQIATGLLPTTTVLGPRMPWVPQWSNNADPLWVTDVSYPDLVSPMRRFTDPTIKNVWGINTPGDITTVDQVKQVLARMFAVYRGMIEYNDRQMGLIVTHLQTIGEYNNTLFIFLSDNGGDVVEWDWKDRNDLPTWGINNTLANLGRQNSFFSNGYGWGQVANTPMDYGKTYMHEGGVSQPLIIVHPQNANIPPNSLSWAFTTAPDIAATILDYAQVPHPVGVGVPPSWATCTGSYAGKTGICPMNGKSMRPILEDASLTAKIHDFEPIGYELWGNTNKALYLEDGTSVWKIRKVGDFGASGGIPPAQTPWSLYDINWDLSEQRNLAGTNPTKLTQMINLYNTYEYNVSYIGTSTPTLSKKIGGQAGKTATYSFALTNPATSVTDTFSFACQSPLPCVINSPNPVVLAPGASTNIVATVTLPSPRPIGTTFVSQINVRRTTVPRLARNFSMVTNVLGYYLFPVISK
jgi:arylsulfatase